jgi:hypothetical protein
VTVYGSEASWPPYQGQLCGHRRLTNVTQTGKVTYLQVEFAKGWTGENVFILDKSLNIVVVTIDKMTSKTVEVRENFQGARPRAI